MAEIDPVFMPVDPRDVQVIFPPLLSEGVNAVVTLPPDSCEPMNVIRSPVTMLIVAPAAFGVVFVE
jgi:hypothetical protein